MIWFMRTHRRIARIKAGLFLALFFVATGAAATDLLSVKPAQLDFKKVSQGKASVLPIRLKTSAVLAVAIKLSIVPPFVIDRTGFSMDKLAFSDVTVTLPSTAPIGNYNGKLVLEVAPIGIRTESYEKIEVPLHADVVSAIPDFSADAKIDHCKNQGKFLNCTINIFLSTTGPAPAAVRTVIFQSVDGKDETTALDRILEYGPGTAAPQVLEASRLPSKSRRLNLRISIDPENQVEEENEDNNTKNVVLDIPKASDR